MIIGRIFRVLVCAFAAIATSHAAETAPSTVVLPPFAANLSQLNIKLTIRYQRRPTGQVVDAVFVRSIKRGSIAEKAGLKQGMELVAIQYQPVAGLNPFQFEAVCDQAVDDALVLVVKRSPKASPEEVRIKLEPDSAKP